jgi:phosphate transport system ATP-binding protein
MTYQAPSQLNAAPTVASVTPSEVSVAVVTRPTCLEVRALSLGFGSATVMADLNAEVPRGAITALIGPTGSGKTTFLRSLNRMNDKVMKHWHKGDVLLEGSNIYAPGVQLMALRRRVGMVFQRPNPFPMSIAGNVLAGVKAHRIATKDHYRDIVERRLKEVGLWNAVANRLNSSPFNLSGGQQQLLCLARALAVGPEVLLLDEPTSSLDPITTENIEQMIRSLVPALTIIIVTHNLGQARRISDRTMFFYQGKLVEFDDTEKLFTEPQQPETAGYVSGRMG